MRLIFDGHLDLALFALAHNRDQTESVAQINAREAHMTDALERGGATVSLPEMRRAGTAACQSPVSMNILDLVCQGWYSNASFYC